MFTQTSLGVYQLRTTVMKYLVKLAIVIVSLVGVSRIADASNNVDRDAVQVADVLTQVDSLCYGPGALRCTCVFTESQSTTKRKVIDCGAQNITELPSWNETKDSGLGGPVSVSFNYNRLTRISSIGVSHVIEALSFDGNHIDALSPYAFQGVVNLKVLSLIDNRLDKIGHHDLHTKLSPSGLVLEELDLSDNFLVHVDDDAFEQLPMLRVLRLSNNPIHTVDLSTIQALNSIHRLEVLQMSGAHLTSLPPQQLVNPIRNLLELDLSYNRLTYVPEALQNAEHLLRLNLDGNPIDQLDVTSFFGLACLEELDINNMTELLVIYSGTFTTLPKLTQLRCSDNFKLGGIETTAFFDRHGHHGTKQLKTIILNNNNLSAFNQETFARMPSVTLQMQGNPLHCSCHAAWLQMSYGDLSCATPASLNGTLLKDVDFSQAPCDGLGLGHEHHDDQHSKVLFLGLAASLGFLTLVIVVGALLVVTRRAGSPYPKAHYRRAHNNDACELYNEY